MWLPVGVAADLVCTADKMERTVAVRNAHMLFFFFKIFFLMWTIFKVFIEFVTILSLFYILVF